ncbi:MAG: hypothetical protein QW057_04885 [Candidatus Bathyarchaeia archaeon]
MKTRTIVMVAAFIVVGAIAATALTQPALADTTAATAGDKTRDQDRSRDQLQEHDRDCTYNGSCSYHYQQRNCEYVDQLGEEVRTQTRARQGVCNATMSSNGPQGNMTGISNAFRHGWLRW